MAFRTAPIRRTAPAGSRGRLTTAARAVVLCMCLAPCAGTAASAGGQPVREEDAAYRALHPVLLEIHKRELGHLYREEAARGKIEDAGVELGTWQRIGPFRDRPPLLNWMENVASSFAHGYEAEKDVAANGGAPLLGKVYRAENFPATPKATRQWTAHREWIDGYLCDLPRGPAPSAGETQYVYRQIAAKKPVTIELEFAVRSPESDRRQEAPNMEHWRRQARYQCWLNGKTVIRYDGRGRIPRATQLALKPGTNHFLAKITNNRHAYGFSFAVIGPHPAPRRPGAHEQPWRPFRSYRAGDLPYFREAEDASWCVSGADWWEALFASAEAYKARFADKGEGEIVIADFEGPDYGDWKATGEAFGPGPARGTQPRQMKVTGFQGKGLVNTYFKGDGATGTLTSPPVKIQRRYINFLIGGGGYAGKTCINLLVGGRVVRTAVGPNRKPGGSEALDWHSWDVGEFAGKQAVIQIVDRHKGGWGHINVDQITLSNRTVRRNGASQKARAFPFFPSWLVCRGLLLAARTRGVADLCGDAS